MAWQPAVNRHVAYIRDIDEDTEPFPSYVVDYAKRRPAVVTAVNMDDTLDLRVGHSGETYSDVALKTADGQTGVYVPY